MKLSSTTAVASFDGSPGPMATVLDSGTQHWSFSREAPRVRLGCSRTAGHRQRQAVLLATCWLPDGDGMSETAGTGPGAQALGGCLRPCPSWGAGMTSHSPSPSLTFRHPPNWGCLPSLPLAPPQMGGGGGKPPCSHQVSIFADACRPAQLAGPLGGFLWGHIPPCVS